MKSVNELILCGDDYSTQEEFEKEVGKAIVLLANAGYIMIARYESPGTGVLSIEFNPVNREYGCAYPQWIVSKKNLKIRS